MRLVTRADLDGLACALMLLEKDDFEEIVLVHPQQITDKTVDIRPDDTLANLPYHPACGRWFDHHLLTRSNEQPPDNFEGLHREAPSAAQLVWEYLGEPAEHARMVRETNLFDAAQLTESDVLKPQDWILLGFTVDPRTGHVDQEDFFRRCLQWLGGAEEPALSLNEVLVLPEVNQRIQAMFEQNEAFCWELMNCSRLDGNVVFSDFRGSSSATVGNRFLVYTLFPEANVSVRAQWGPGKERVMVQVGHSIFDRSCQVSVGELMSEYGGGGHRGAGSAPLDVMEADVKILEIIDALKAS